MQKTLVFKATSIDDVWDKVWKYHFVEVLKIQILQDFSYHDIKSIHEDVANKPRPLMTSYANFQNSIS